MCVLLVLEKKDAMVSETAFHMHEGLLLLFSEDGKF